MKSIIQYYNKMHKINKPNVIRNLHILVKCTKMHYLKPNPKIFNCQHFGDAKSMVCNFLLIAFSLTIHRSHQVCDFQSHY